MTFTLCRYLGDPDRASNKILVHTFAVISSSQFFGDKNTEGCIKAYFE